MNKISKVCLQFFLSLSLCIFFAQAVSQFESVKAVQLDTTRVTVKPSTGYYSIGETFEVEVWVEDVTDLYGADVRLIFDPAKLEVIDANPSTPDVIDISPESGFLYPDFVVRKDADNSIGIVRYAAAQMNPRPPASGSGPICSFYLRVLSEGQSGLTFEYSKLSNRDGEEIPAEAIGASYNSRILLFLPIILK